jgi:transposase
VVYELARVGRSNVFLRKDSAMKILALDMGNNKSVYVDYLTGHGEQFSGKIDTNPHALQKLLVMRQPDRLVIEAGPAAGWVADLAQKMHIEIQVANCNDERWRWKVVKEKSDRRDALKLAQMSEMGSLPTVHVPESSVRQWRSLIGYRHVLVERRTAVKNSIRAIYQREGIRLSAAGKCWSKESLEGLKKEAAEAQPDQLWLFQVKCELEQMESLQKRIDEVEAKLEEIADSKPQVRRLQTAPCVGPRLSEAISAFVDDPHRFKSGRQAACYVGLTPRRWQSGNSDRQGHISKAGNRRLRHLLVEVAWQGVWRNTWMTEVFNQIYRGNDKRKKIAIVAVARRLLVRLWAMLRDGTDWRDPLPAATP